MNVIDFYFQAVQSRYTVYSASGFYSYNAVKIGLLISRAPL
jgi:hypothetical protein